MSQIDEQFLPLQPPSGPAEDDRDGWKALWEARGQPWRREPEISRDQKASLTGAMSRPGQYSVWNNMRLTRADVEWLLAILEGGRGPIDWSDAVQRSRAGLDLSGARLENVDLSDLPLAGVRVCLSPEAWREISGEDPRVGSRADRLRSNLRGANLSGAHLEGANLDYAFLGATNFDGAILDEASLRFVWLDAEEEMFESRKQAASLAHVSARNARFTGSRMQGVTLDEALLSGADLRETLLSGASLRGAYLAGTDLRMAAVDEFTNVDGAIFGDGAVSAALGGMRFITMDLTRVNWDLITRLGDEAIAHKSTTPEGKKKSRSVRIAEFAAAARTYRQLSQALQRQRLDGPAGEFSYRAQTLQRELTLRRILWQAKIGLIGSYLFSLLLAALTGYGYRLGRILRAYVLAVAAFAGAFYVLGLVRGPRLQWYEALFVSLTAFHGRVFAEVFSPGSPQIWVTAGEAICGLLVESVFIAMLTRRLFGRD